MTCPAIEWSAITIDQGRTRRDPLPGAADLYDARVQARAKGLTPIRFEWSIGGETAGAFDEERPLDTAA